MAEIGPPLAIDWGMKTSNDFETVRVQHEDQFITVLTESHAARLDARAIRLLAECGYEWIYLPDFRGWRRIKRAIEDARISEALRAQGGR